MFAAGLWLRFAGGAEAAAVDGVSVYALKSLPEALELLRAPMHFQPVARTAVEEVVALEANGTDAKGVDYARLSDSAGHA